MGTLDRVLEKDLVGAPLIPEGIGRYKIPLISRHPSKVFWGINDKFTIKQNVS